MPASASMDSQGVHSDYMPHCGLELHSIPGSSPNWSIASLGGGHQGRKHIPAADSFESGLDLSSSRAPLAIQPRRRAISPQPSHEAAQPVVQGCDRAYYVRRQLHPEYRRHHAYADANMGTWPACLTCTTYSLSDAAGPPSSGPRAEGKRLVAVPQGAPPPLQGCRQFPECKMETVATVPEPLIPRMARYTVQARHLESNAEFSLDRALSRKVRVGRDTYSQTGRAGDMSIRTGPTPRVEDESAYRQQTIDSPTFVRFCKNLPKLPELGPHQRHHAAVQRQASAMQQLVAEDVMRLDAWDDQQHARQAVAAAAQPAVPPGKKK